MRVERRAGKGVIAALVLAGGRAVPRETLIDRVWGSDNPPKRGTVWSEVSRIRNRMRDFSAGRLDLREIDGSYSLAVDQESVDVLRFRRLCGRAQAAARNGDDEGAVALWTEALALWGGEPLAGVAGEWASATRVTLRDEHAHAVLRRAEAAIRLGRSAEVLGEVRELEQEKPDDEDVVRVCMLVLYNCGRTSEALDLYHGLRLRLRDTRGVDPQRQTRELYERMLRHDIAVPQASPDGLSRVAADAAAISTLPPAVRDFTGRARELAALLGVLPRTASEPTVIWTVHGMSGIGKSALALQAAHAAAEHFPDLRLYLDLRAYNQGRPALDAQTALGELLRMTGMPAQGIPSGLDARAAAWRERVADRRLLLVLDDVAGAEQVRRLLPTGNGCAVLVTSRNRLFGVDGARSLKLDDPPPEEAAALFAQIAELSPSEEGVGEVVRLLSRLPFAVRMMAHRLRNRQGWTAADLARRLAATRNRLAEIHDGDQSLAAAFDMSLRALPTPARDAFVRLGLHPSAEFGLYAGAALVGRPVSDTERLLERLLDEHLLEEAGQRRYRFHDLVGQHARALALSDLAAPDRDAAVDRMLAHYREAAEAADRVINPDAWEGAEPARPSTEVPGFDGPHAVRRWFEAEQGALVASMECADEWERPRHLARLPALLSYLLYVYGQPDVAAHMFESAATACDELGDDSGLAGAVVDLARAHRRAGRLDDALLNAEMGLELARMQGDLRCEADAHDEIGLVHFRAARYPDALVSSQQALSAARETDYRLGMADALAHSALSLRCMDDYRGAISQFEEAHAISRTLRTPFRKGSSMLGHAGAYFLFGMHRQAGDLCEEALRLAQENELPLIQAAALHDLGLIEAYKQRHRRALELYQRGLTVLNGLGQSPTAEILADIGRSHLRLDAPDIAMSLMREAEEMSRRSGRPADRAKAAIGIAEVHRARGEYRESEIHYRRAAGEARRAHALLDQGNALSGLGHVLLLMDRGAEAADTWQRALTILMRLGVPDAEPVRIMLDSVLPAGAAVRSDVPRMVTLAICGSRVTGSDDAMLDSCARALGGHLAGRAVHLVHGPVGIALEIVAHMGEAATRAQRRGGLGTLGHADVVRDADYVVVLGGGVGTQQEVDTALALGKRVIPVPASGGVARAVHRRMGVDVGLRSWMPDAEFTALAACEDGDSLVAVLERLLSAGGGAHEPAPSRTAQLRGLSRRIYRRLRRPPADPVQ
ncbi:AfsR/SARP family transcriptional regulator [Allonocardiopsis opalescens]|nr:BTAD domain-containing putative transcriptional regulator [Allonocardiopsis opalescens]